MVFSGGLNTPTDRPSFAPAEAGRELFLSLFSPFSKQCFPRPTDRPASRGQKRVGPKKLGSSNRPTYLGPNLGGCSAASLNETATKRPLVDKTRRGIVSTPRAWSIHMRQSLSAHTPPRAVRISYRRDHEVALSNSRASLVSVSVVDGRKACALTLTQC